MLVGKYFKQITHTDTHESKFMCAIYFTQKITEVPPFVLLLYISRKDKCMLKQDVSHFAFGNRKVY